jgi:hypothetical protein
VELNTESCKERHIFSLDTISTNSRGSGIGQQAERSDISQTRSSQTGLKGKGDTGLVAFQTPRPLSGHCPKDTEGTENSMRVATPFVCIYEISALEDYLMKNFTISAVHQYY